jgi:raffinose/stachyose/melibiose transport system permease protein
MKTAPVPHDAFPNASRYRLVATYAVLAVFAYVVVVPLVATFLGGFKSLGELRVNPVGLPREWLWNNYTDILWSASYWTMLKNSLVIAALSVIVTVLLASMAAFAFAHVRFFGSRMISAYFLLGIMFPMATAAVPLFILIRDLGLLDTYMAIVLPKVAGGLSVAIVLFANYFKQMPAELFEAAAVDGCGYWRYYLYIVMPLAGPIVATVSIVNFVACWNMYFLPLVLLSSPEMMTWPVRLMDYTGERGSDWGLICAYVTLTMLPTIIVFLLAQRHILSGLTAGAVKS